MKQNVWHKSTKSGPAGHCVEAFWKKASFSQTDNCVEAKGEDDLVLVRDTKLGEASPVLSFRKEDWELFLADIRQEYHWPRGGDLQTAPGNYLIMHTLESGLRGDQLEFTREEWDAFVEGVKLGEFDLQAA